MGDLFDTPGKKAVREAWNSPILRYLNQKFGFRYRYMGLPGVGLLDVKLWKDMIEEIIAFELTSEPSPQDPDGRLQIRTLRRNLQIHQIPGYVYCGPMEEVILLGTDYDGQKYSQNKLITLYNLDFCDEISSSVPTKNRGEQLLRFQAIDYLLTEQIHLYRQNQEHNYFILLLTVRNQIDAGRLRGYLTSGLLEESRSYLAECGGLGTLPATGPCIGDRTWALKTFIHDFLRKSFHAPRISSLFFPIVKYQGNLKIIPFSNPVSSPMLHCMIFCRFDENKQGPAPESLPVNFLNSVPSLYAENPQRLVWAPEQAEPLAKMMKEPPDSLAWFKKFESHFLPAIK